jgi:3-methyladenine DNA glycosylase/8-oxoguanine DNA glycosylase
MMANLVTSRLKGNFEMALELQDITTSAETITAHLIPAAPYSFKRSLESLKESGANDQTDTLDPGLKWLERPVKIGDAFFLLRLEDHSPDSDNPLLNLTLRASDEADDPPGEIELQEAVRRVSLRFYLEIDMQEVRRVLSVNEYGEELVNRFWPTRPTGLGGAWEGLLRTVISNQIYPGLAVRLQQSLLDIYGQKASFGGVQRRLFPSPVQLVEVMPDELLALRFSRQKAAYLPGIAKKVLDEPEKYDFETMRNLPGEEAVAVLDELPGVGPWTAQYVAMRGLYHNDVFIDEGGLRKTLAAAFDRRADISEEELRKLVSVYAPCRTFACYYSYMRMYNV